MITTKEITYGKFGRCVQVSNGTIDFVATLDLGPRIIRFGFCNGENELYEDIDNNLTNNNPEFKEKFESDEGWFIYGGHRLWSSPEAEPRSYYPDNEPVKYEEIPNGVRLTPPPQKWTNLQFEMELTISSENSVEVFHKITNIGAWHSEFAIWALTVMAQNGLEIVPLATKETGLLPNRKLAIWAYTNMADSRVNWGSKYVTVKQDPNADSAFKFGTNCEDGWAAYFNHGNLFVKRFPADGENYPDGGMSFETYTNQYIMEIESLGELKNVAPSESITHTEQWQLIKGVERPNSTDESTVAAIIEKYV